MADIKRLLAERSKKNKIKPDFIMKEAKFPGGGLLKRWRMPRGKHSFVRQKHRGKQAMPTPGYGAPRAVRGLHHSGLQPVVVCTKKDMEALDGKTQGAIISGKVGARKKLLLLAYAGENGITLLTGDPATLERKLRAQFDERKKVKKEKIQRKEQKQTEKKKKAAEKEKKDAEVGTKEPASSDAESVETKVTEEEKQKELVSKTITKRQ